MIETTNKFVRGALHTLMSAAVADIGRAVRPIYFATERQRPEHLGSCVLVNYNSRHLLLTAAHVIDANKHSALYLPVGGTLQKLEGAGLSTVAPSGNRDKDHFDFSIIDLPSGLVAALGPIRYVQEHELQREAALGRAYMAFGFPNSQNKSIDHHKRKVVSRRFSYGGPLFFPNVANGDQFPAREEHLLRIKYERQSRTVEGDVVNSIGPRGISGGGLFDLGRILAVASGPIDSPRLAGILIERRRKERTLVATDISTLLSVL